MFERIDLLKGDITKVEADAIVNAANKSLLGGGGVDGAIHRAGGRSILEECKEIAERQGGCKVGEAVITTAGNLPAKFVIHAVGPVWEGGHKNESVKLSNCYKNSLLLAAENNCKSVAFPCISTGVYGYPLKPATEVAVKTVADFLLNNETIEKVIFICFDDESYFAINEKLENKW